MPFPKTVSYTPLWKARDTGKNPSWKDLLALYALLWRLAFLQDFPDAALENKNGVRC